MCAPAGAPGMEQFGHSTGLRVYAGEIGAFMQIAVNAGEGEVVIIVSAPVDFRNDVLDMKWGQWRIVLAQPAILATVTRATTDAGLGRRVLRLRFGATR